MADARKDASESLSNALQESKRLLRKRRIADAITVLEAVVNECENATLSLHSKVAKRLATLCCVQPYESEAVCAKSLRAAERALHSARVRRSRDGLAEDEALLRLSLLTYNGWAAYHKEKKNYHLALNFLMRAAKVIEEVGQKPSPEMLEYCAKTKLNISALYSDLRRYREAADYAEQCLATLQLEMTQRMSGRRVSELSPAERSQFDGMIRTFVVAFYNVGVAEEALGLSANALQAFRNAVTIGSKFLSSEVEELKLARKALTGTVVRRKSMVAASSALESEEEKALFATQQSTETDCHKQSLYAPLSEPRKEPLKYYSEERLRNLHARLMKGPTVDFVSADNYFLTKIARNLAVNSDVQHMKALSIAELISAETRLDPDRRLLANLRQRRHPHRVPQQTVRGKELVQKQISRIEEELEAYRKRTEVKKLSRSKTKMFRSASQRQVRIASPQEAVHHYPPQRLFFRGESSRCQSPIIRSCSPPRRTQRVDCKAFKDEIVQQMDELAERLKPREKKNLRAKSCEILSFDCELSASARKQESATTSRRRSTRFLVAEEVKQLATTVERRSSIKLQRPSHPNPSFTAFQQIYRQTR